MTTSDKIFIEDWLRVSSDNVLEQAISPDAEMLDALTRAMMGWDSLLDDMASASDSRRQGMLKSLYELQQGLVQISGLHQAALSLGSLRHAVHAGMAMLSRYGRQRDGKLRTLLVVGAVSNGFTEAAREIAIDWASAAVLPSQPLDVESIGAIVLPLSMLYAAEVNLAAVDTYRKKGGVVIVDGINQYLLPWVGDENPFPADILLLDQALLFGVEGAPPALVVSERFDAFLPLPVITENDGQFIQPGEDLRPSSIGALHQGIADLPLLFHCFISLRARGVRGVQEQMLGALVATRYLFDSLAAPDDNDDVAGLDRRALYGHNVVIRCAAVADDSMVMRLVELLDVSPIKEATGIDAWHFPLRKLTELDADSITRFARELAAMQPRPVLITMS